MERYIEYEKFIISEMNNPVIEQFDVIFNYYKNLSQEINFPKKDYKKTNVQSDLIHNFFYDFDKKYSFDTAKEEYEFNYSLKKVYDLSFNLFNNGSLTYDKKIVMNSIQKVMVLFFQDYLLQKNKSFKNIIKDNRNKRREDIFSRLNSVNKKLKIIDLYKKNKEDLHKYIDTYDLSLEELSVNLNDDYEYLSSNLITEFLYNDKKKTKKVIDLINNNSSFDLDSLNCFFDNKRFKLKRKIKIFSVFIIVIIFVLNFNVNSKASEEDLCLNSVYNKEIANLCVERLFENNVLLMNTNYYYIKELENKINVFSDYELNQKIDNAYKQYNDMNLFKENLKKLFLDDNLKSIREDITLKERYEIYNLFISLPQKNFIEENMIYMERIDEVIKKRETIEIIDIPFVSQKDEEVYNGCEAASLLMALKNRNKLKNYMLKDFIEYMPMHEDDPYQGFIYSVYDYEPLSVAHWIAPKALAEFGSNYSKTIDISGSDVETLKRYVYENRPVIVYITAQFEEPIITSQEVPLNLHVVLLVGYNQVTGEYIVLDPYHGRLVVEKDKFENSYNHLKYAVVVE